MLVREVSLFWLLWLAVSLQNFGVENLGTLLVDHNAAFPCASDFGVMLDLLPTLDSGAHLGYGVMLDLFRPFPCIGCGGRLRFCISGIF